MQEIFLLKYQNILLSLLSKNIFLNFSYLTPFAASKEYSPVSLGVMNKVIQKVELPREFVNKIITHIIEFIEAAENKDTKICTAKELAYFITSLIDSAHISSYDNLPKKVKIFYFIFRLMN